MDRTTFGPENPQSRRRETYRKRANSLVGAAALTLGAAACGGAPTSPTSSAKGHVELSCSESYSSATDMQQSSDVVVLATPEGQSSRTDVGEVPFALSPLRVIKAYHGAVSGAVLLRQLDASNSGPGGETPALLTAGSDYLLYLRHFEFTPGVRVGNQYVAIGCGQAIYASSADGYQAVGPADAVPATVTEP